MNAGIGQSPPFKEQQDFELRSLELEIKKQELKLKEAELKTSSFKNPLVVGIFVAALGLFGNIGITYLQNREQQSLAQQRAQSDLILEAIKTGDVQKASANLQFFIGAHLINDEHGYIMKAVDAGHSPTLPAPVAEQMAEEYWMGRGGRPLDYSTALKLFQIAADQGNAQAMANIGWSYENGFGVQRDYALAMNWYRKAVEHGYFMGNWNIGRLYEFGWGVPVDLNAARSYYKKAVEQGYAHAQQALDNVGHNDPMRM